MATFLNPVQYIDDLVHLFADAAKKPDGITIDAVLCGIFAEGLTELSEKVDALVAYARADGLVSGALEAERARTPVERQLLARQVIQAEPGARVVYLPEPAFRAAAASEGGSAA